MIRRTIIFVATVWRMAVLYAVFFAKYDAWADLFRQYRAARGAYARAVADAYGGAAAFDAVRFDPQTVRQFYFRVLVDG